MNKRISLAAVIFLLFSGLIGITHVASAAPVVKVQKTTLTFDTKSTILRMDSVQTIVDISGAIRKEFGENVGVSFTNYKKVSGATKADLKVNKKRIKTTSETIREIISQAKFNPAVIKTYKSSSSPKRNRLDVTFQWTLPLPTAVAIAPNAGSLGGGTTVSISGSNFYNVQKVTFGGIAAASFVVNSPTRITAVTPVKSAGIVDVLIETAGGNVVLGRSFTFANPSITSITPNTGIISGGTSIVIAGTNLTGATEVLFGLIPATSFVVNSANQITAVAPSGDTGEVEVSITTPLGKVTSTQKFRYVAPAINSVTPSSGPINGGTIVVITGSNLSGVSAVSFGGIPAQSFTVNSSTQITAVTPVRASAGPVAIEITLATGTVNSTYTYIAAPTITSISPSSGSTSGGLSILITGTNFSGVSSVTFGGTKAQSFTVNSETQITAVTPVKSSGVANVQVTTAGGIATSPLAFTYTAPTITSLSPTSGPTAGDTVITISGSNLLGTTAVTFGGTNAKSFTVISSTTISAIAPAKAAGAITVNVVTPGATLSSTYTYLATPSISSLSPASGTTAGGTTVTISGSNLTGVTSVRFGNLAAASFTVVSASQIVAITPASPAAAVNVTVLSPGGSATRAFTFTASAPSITSVTPSSGSTSGGTTVVIAGTNFTGTTAVTFGGTNATSFTVNSATQITAVAPAKVAGNVTLSVVTPGGTVNAAFAYSALPTASTLSPSSGTTSGGTVVVIAGTNFTGATAVRFGGTNATNFTINSSTQITATTPARASGPVTVDVVTPGGIARASDVFVFEASVPTITSFTPSFGSTAGATTVVITGTNFIGTSAVSIAGAGATFTVNSATQITAVSAAGTGSGSITVTTSGGTATSAAEFTYVAPPVITSLDVETGPTSGGTTVVITGTGFTGTTSVTFGGTAAAIVSASATEITVTTPERAAGVVAVIVTSAIGSATKANAFTYTAP